ncbi:tRNA pseudouridine(55) synthase [Staphylococcus sp. HMSC068D08]|uniref:tRNA pseudouridine(55) synthase TruB n=1 Tax=Staphylococcus TaxID=1279 RepID=UPI0008A178A0|nr:MULTISPECIES: tRNA pseudouridine(55) synthase TruB [Staphylococcus]MCC2084289.1 tRNA pseudouridine(55) synthase TruB [Staphylococcus lugdunensis]MCH8679700.1 tRNA pseudouridine(55) synthase TruB [Staphylococcus lugdunensis]MCI2826698.1 tRNA pseudouridine(55) synthase TruB [Staphylococcus lugdunensis]MCI2837465.1 tRNA pseudouridine(55) synthase TruB [Staphylococcus lugdunensis]MDU1592042.1 tRNA pseudouridine(55) synthase TruB [Staphylococcus lugdunensis]
MYNGILPVRKERGLTSHDVVFKLRKILQTRKIGHTGTLDPEVDGVLPVCIGIATRVSDYIMDMGKTYHATVAIGISTTTEDQTGDILEQKTINVGEITSEAIDSTLAQFQGWITQIPPMYSSVKVKGKKLYEYARNGETVERPERKVEIKSIQRVSEIHFKQGMCLFDIDITCGKGTYIRTLATDIGKALGFPAHMSRLTRTSSGGFNISDSLTIEQIKVLHEQEQLQEKLFPIEYGLKGLPSIEIYNEDIKHRILNGQKFQKAMFSTVIQQQIVFIDGRTQQVLAIYISHPDKPKEIKPKKVFN